MASRRFCFGTPDAVCACGGPLLAAAIFAFHPVNVMSVAWMTELKNTLSLALALGSVLAYVKVRGAWRL